MMLNSPLVDIILTPLAYLMSWAVVVKVRIVSTFVVETSQLLLKDNACIPQVDLAVDPRVFLAVVRLENPLVVLPPSLLLLASAAADAW